MHLMDLMDLSHEDSSLIHACMANNRDFLQVCNDS